MTQLQKMLDDLDKLAAASDPGQVGGKSTHPTTKEDNGMGPLYTGSRFQENTEDIKSDPVQEGHSVEDTTPNVTAEQAATATVMNNEAPKLTGNDPKNETETAKSTTQDSQVSGQSQHPARANNNELQKQSELDELRSMVRGVVESSNKVAQMISKEAGVAVLQSEEGSDQPKPDQAEPKQAASTETTAQELASIDPEDEQVVKQATYDIIEAVRSDATTGAVKVAYYLHGIERMRQEREAQAAKQAAEDQPPGKPESSDASSKPEPGADAAAGPTPGGDEMLAAGDAMEIPEELLGGEAAGPAEGSPEGEEIAELVAELLGSGEVDPEMLLELLSELEGGGAGAGVPGEELGGAAMPPDMPPGMPPGGEPLPEDINPAMLEADPKLAHQVRKKIAMALITGARKKQAGVKKVAQRATPRKKESAVTSRITELLQRSRR